MKSYLHPRFLAFMVGLLFFSCSSGDNPDPIITIPGADYFPLAIANYWTYDVNGVDNGTNQDFTGRDSLYITGTTTINTQSYFDLDASMESIGVMTGILSTGSIRNDSNRMYLTGSLNIPFEGLEGFNIELDDTVLFDDKAQADFVLSEFSGQLTDTVQGFPITATYTLKSINGSSLSSYAVNENTYENVIRSKLIVEVSITSKAEVLGQTITFDLLKPQNVLTIENTYANGVGLVESDSEISYQLEDFSSLGVEFPFPSTVSIISRQELDIAVVTASN